ncbi:TonB family protein [Methylorubrum thiocyanatum]|uniref:TonB family protein n=1 Tax=Methylorubrum thiocyanatum TaxID=47958 RepID=UPI003F7FF2B2
MRTPIAIVLALTALPLVSLPADAAGTMAAWNAVAFRLIRCNIQYPRVQNVPAAGAVAIVQFEVGRDGYIGAISLDRSSGITVFDEAALVAVKLSSPLPPPPAPDNRTVSARVPIRFMPPPVPFLRSPTARSPCRLHYGS